MIFHLESKRAVFRFDSAGLIENSEDEDCTVIHLQSADLTPAEGEVEYEEEEIEDSFGFRGGTSG